LVRQFQLRRVNFEPVYQIQLCPAKALKSLRDQPFSSCFDRLVHRFATLI